MEYHTTLMTFDKGCRTFKECAALRRLCNACSPRVCKHFTEGHQDICHALPHFNPLTVKYAHTLRHSSGSLLPVAAGHIELLHNGLADPSAQSSVPLSIPPCTSKMFVMTR